MKRASLPILVALLSSVFLLPADFGVAQPARSSVVAPPAPALFSARSAQVKGDALIVADLQEVNSKTAPGALGGRVLLSGDSGVELGLWVLKVDVDMARATPFLGEEGPGATFLKPGKPGPSGSEFVPFRAPVRVTLTHLDASGTTLRTEQQAVREIRRASAGR
jgi:hypothetical protein